MGHWELHFVIRFQIFIIIPEDMSNHLFASMCLILFICLFTGGPGAGKSTYLKQVRLNYGDRFPQSERRLFHDRILQNVATSLVHLLEHMDKMDLKFETAETQVRELF